MSRPITRAWARPWMLYAALIVHGVWAGMLCVSADPLGCTPMAESPFGHNRFLAAAVYAFASVAALVALTVPKLDLSWWGLVLCLPQQFLMLLSAGTAILCVLRSTYADGVPRPALFIAADQLWGIVGMTMHSAALLDWCYWSRLKRGE